MKQEISDLDGGGGSSGFKLRDDDRPDCAAPKPISDQPLSAGLPRFPSGSCDSHAHIFPSPSLYPLYSGRNYTPHVCTLEMYLELLEALGVQRAVLVQPSVYGTDNSALLDTLKQFGNNVRGVAVPSPTVSDQGLQDMHAAGVRGVRLNLANPSVLTVKDAIRLCQRVAPWGWHLQVHMKLSDGNIGDLLQIVESVPCRVVLDHLGRICPAKIPSELFSLLKEGRTWIKFSAPYRFDADFQELKSAVMQLYKVAPDKLLWGSDWPHTEQINTPAYSELLHWVNDCFPDIEPRTQVLVKNPDEFYFSQ